MKNLLLILVMIVTLSTCATSSNRNYNTINKTVLVRNNRASTLVFHIDNVLVGRVLPNQTRCLEITRPINPRTRLTVQERTGRKVRIFFTDVRSDWKITFQYLNTLERDAAFGFIPTNKCEIT